MALAFKISIAIGSQRGKLVLGSELPPSSARLTPEFQYCLFVQPVSEIIFSRPNRSNQIK